MSLESESAPSLAVLGDAGALRRALANLLSNAVRVSNPGGSVRVRAGHDAEMVWVSVVDNGPGIGVEDLVRVFDRFWSPGTAWTPLNSLNNHAFAVLSSHWIFVPFLPGEIEISRGSWNVFDKI